MGMIEKLSPSSLYYVNLKGLNNIFMDLNIKFYVYRRFA